VLDEGKNRNIRRLLAALGVEVLRLVRVAIGPLPLGNLPKGAFRRLTAQEVGRLETRAPEAKPGAQPWQPKVKAASSKETRSQQAAFSTTGRARRPHCNSKAIPS
jgi:hypothetical protein